MNGKILNIIRATGLFDGMESGELEAAAGLFTHKAFKEGEHITTGSNELIIVTAGKIAFAVNLPGSIELKRTEYVPGDIFGEMELFGFKQRAGSYIAVEKSEALSATAKEIESLMEEHSGTAAKLISRLIGQTIRQLRRTSSFLADVVQWGDTASRRVITDELTGVYSRPFLEDAVVNFFEISKSNNKPLSLFMMDIDNFREINNTFGFDTGNIILKESVSIIQKVISKHGIIARYGGDEFCVLLPETTLVQAKKIAEKIRVTVEKYDFSPHLPGSPYKVTTSIGISSFPETATELEAFTERADASLYKAKELGRNRVEAV